MPKTNLILTKSHDRIIASLHGYSALIVFDDMREHPELDELFALVLLDWAITTWDWESVATLTENRTESLKLAENQVCYTLSDEDLVGLFAGKYERLAGYDPRVISSFLDVNDKISDAWASIQAYCYVPVSRFNQKVIDEMMGKS